MRERILIVEDERITAEDLREVLGGFGYEVLAVVAPAPTHQRRGAPDAGFGFNGYPHQRRYGRHRTAASCTSGSTSRWCISRPMPIKKRCGAPSSAALAYVVKPFREPEMQAAIEIALHRHRQDRKTAAPAPLESSARRSAVGVISVDAASCDFVQSRRGGTHRLDQRRSHRRPLRSVFAWPTRRRKVGGVALDEVLKRGSLHEIRTARLVMKNGERRSISGNISPVPGIDGFTGAIIVLNPRQPLAAIHTWIEI